MKRSALVPVLIAIVLFGGGLLYLNSRSTSSPMSETSANNVAVIDGTQYIDLTAKGGYVPRASTAQAGMPTILRVQTKGTFDCSSSIRIPTLNVSKNLPQSGVTEIDLGSPQAGILQGMCGMGMYPFQIEFRS
jgi:plastocyanin domain-containing protein